MTKFELPSFSTPHNSKKYRDNFDAVFGKKDKKKKAPQDKPEEPDVSVEDIDADSPEGYHPENEE